MSRSTTITTATGRVFDLARPRPSDVCIEDVAHHLATVNRFNGAAQRPISVAEHSLLVVEILEREHGVTSPLVLRAAQFHDGEEAYTPDASSPLKLHLERDWGLRWNAVTRRIKQAVLQHFGVHLVYLEHAALIKAADQRAYATERRDLCRGPVADDEQHLQPVDWIDLRSRDGMSWTDWRTAFLARHEELGAALEHLA